MISQEENNRMSKAIDELAKKNEILSKRLRDHGIDDSIVAHENVHDVAIIHKRQTVYQGTLNLTPLNIYKLRIIERFVVVVVVVLRHRHIQI